jgi:hypothetical protein
MTRKADMTKDIKESDVTPSIWETFYTDSPIPPDLEKHIETYRHLRHVNRKGSSACPIYIVPDMSIWICFHDQDTWDDVYGSSEAFHPLVLMFHVDGEMGEQYLSETHHHTWEQVLVHLRHLLKSGYTAPSCD